MLIGAEPRGLPGIRILKVQFQRRADGHLLDDVIVHGEDAGGIAATLGVQVKRSVSFAPSDPVFRDVVLQMGQTVQRDDFTSARYEMAVAIERTSAPIEHYYQEVLRWARTHSTAAEFMAHIARRGQASEAMRTFVKTVRDHLSAANFSHDDEVVWRILRRFQILQFDFGHQGSLSEAWARDRARLLLAPSDAGRAGELWAIVAEAAAFAAATGGEWTAESLKTHVAARNSFQWAGDLHLAGARRAIAEASRLTLADMRSAIGNVTIDRSPRMADLHAALSQHRYVEIRGDAGVGKSGVLKFFAEQIGIEAATLTLNPERTTPGGWFALRNALNCDCSAKELLSDLATDGGGFLLLDSVDQVDDPAVRATITDLIRAASEVDGFRVVVTARRQSAEDATEWLPADAIARLGPAPPITLSELSDEEVATLSAADSRLAALLDPGHVAKDVVRNLFRLSRLAVHSGSDPLPGTEVVMARQWWSSADGPAGGNARDRGRLIAAMAVAALSGVGSYRTDTAEPAAISDLLARGTIREVSRDLFAFGHDVLRDWGVACLLHDEPQRLDALPWSAAASAALVRGFELCARMALELAEDGNAWLGVFQRASAAGVHLSWRRAALMALVRNERAPLLLDRVMVPLTENSGVLLRELILTSIAADSEPAEAAFRRAGHDISLPPDILAPVGHSWSRLLFWLMLRRDHLPATQLPTVVDLVARWLMATFGRDRLAPTLLTWLHDCLVLWTAPYRPAGTSFSSGDLDWGLDYHEERALIALMRNAFLQYCEQVPELADRYLRSFIGRRPAGDVERALMKLYGATPRVAPAALAALTLYTLTAPDPNDDDRSAHRRHRPDRDDFNMMGHEFHPPSPGQGPFYALLQASPIEGLNLIRAVIDHAIRARTGGQQPGDDALILPFATGSRRFTWRRSYDWSRGNSSSTIVASALMALELWAHGRADAGEPIDAILADLLGDGDTAAAYLLVAVDLLLSHCPADVAIAVPFLSSPALLLLDQDRQSLDAMSASGFAERLMASVLGGIPDIPEPPGLAKLSTLNAKRSRQTSLQEMLSFIALSATDESRLLLQANLQREAERLGPPDPLQETLRD